MIKRALLFTTLIFFPYFASADALNGLAVVYYAYAAIGFVVALFGLIVYAVGGQRKTLKGIAAIICVLVGYPSLDTIYSWGLEMEFVGPLLSFLVGCLLLVSLFLNATKTSGSNPGT